MDADNTAESRTSTLRGHPPPRHASRDPVPFISIVDIENDFKIKVHIWFDPTLSGVDCALLCPLVTRNTGPQGRIPYWRALISYLYFCVTVKLVKFVLYQELRCAALRWERVWTHATPAGSAVERQSTTQQDRQPLLSILAVVCWVVYAPRSQQCKIV